MKNNKQRRLEIKAKRDKKAAASKASSHKELNYRPTSSVKAEHKELLHNAYWSTLPLLYEDKPFRCRDCGLIEVWTASSQKWRYEVAKGYIDSVAVRCKSCRAQKKNEKEIKKKCMVEAALKKPHPNQAFFKKRY